MTDNSNTNQNENIYNWPAWFLKMPYQVRILASKEQDFPGTSIVTLNPNRFSDAAIYPIHMMITYFGVQLDGMNLRPTTLTQELVELGCDFNCLGM